MSIIEEIIEFVYHSKGSQGIYRIGNYNLDEEIFGIAYAEYLLTGIDHLPEYDIIIHASWWNKKDQRHSYPLKENRKYLELFLEGKAFWNPYRILDKSKIQNIKDYLRPEPIKKSKKAF